MLVRRCVAAIALPAALAGGCVTYACPGIIPANQPAIFELSCAPTNLASVSVSGPCATGDASGSEQPPSPASMSVAIASPSPGVCHVVLTFATGFRYSADVTFISQADTAPPGCPVSHYTVPTQRTFSVNNPSNTCVDAGLDAGLDGAGMTWQCTDTGVPCVDGGL